MCPRDGQCCWDVPNDGGGGGVALLVYIKRCVVWLDEGFVDSLIHIWGHVQEIDDYFIRFEVRC